MQYGWALEFPNSIDCSTIEPWNLLIKKKCSDNNLFIDLLISKSNGPSMYTLSMVFPESFLCRLIYPEIYICVAKRQKMHFAIQSCLGHS